MSNYTIIEKNIQENKATPITRLEVILGLKASPLSQSIRNLFINHGCPKSRRTNPSHGNSPYLQCSGRENTWKNRNVIKIKSKKYKNLIINQIK